MDSNSLIIFILLFIVIGMLSYLYSENQKKANEAKNNTDVEVVEYNPYIYYNPYYYDGYPWWWYGSGGYGGYGDRRFYYGGGRRFHHGHGFRRYH
jgi:hypothetical protein